MKVSNFYKGVDAYQKTSEGKFDALVDQVLDQMATDFYNGDVTAIDAMLRKVDPAVLIGFLSEEDEADE